MGINLTNLYNYHPSYFSFYDYSPNGPDELDFNKILNITDDELNNYGQSLSKFDTEHAEINKYLTKLSWAIRSYLTFQDIFEYDITLDSKDLDSNFLGRYYCYYESLIFVRQMTLSLLNINSLASICLLRPVLELSLLNLFFYFKSIEENRLLSKKWLSGEYQKPHFKQMTGYIMSSVPCKTPKIEKILNSCFSSIELGFRNLSSYHHSPKTNESFARKTGAFKISDLEDFLYVLHTINICFFNINTVYSICFPMILFPVDSIHKFGFNGPVGLFNDPYNYKILEKYLKLEFCCKLKNEFNNSDEIKSKLEWIESLPFLSEEEIRNSVSPNNNLDIDLSSPIDIINMYYKAKSRVFLYLSNYIEFNQEYTDLTDNENAFYNKFYDI